MSTTGARKRSMRLQDRICNTPYHLERTFKQVYEQIKRALLSGCRREHLLTPVHRLDHLLKGDAVPGESPRQQNYAILGARRDTDHERRLPADELFQRMDGAVFNFAITLGPGAEAPELISYDFELRFPDHFVQQHRVPRFVRLDLNGPKHPNTGHGMRCHLHPGHDDLQVPTALMTPIEIIELFLYDLMLREKPRTK